MGISHKEYQDRRIQHIHAGYSEPTAEDLERVRELFTSQGLTDTGAAEPYQHAFSGPYIQTSKALPSTPFVPIDINKIKTLDDVISVIGALQVALDPAAHPNMSKYLVGASDDSANCWIFHDRTANPEVLRVTKEGYFIWAEHALARINAMGENEGALKAILLALYRQMQGYEIEFRIQQLQTQLDEARVNAARYEWWRDTACANPVMVAKLLGPLLTPAEIDEMISKQLEGQNEAAS